VIRFDFHRPRDAASRLIYDLCEVGHRAQKQGIDPINIFRAAATISMEDHNRRYPPAPTDNAGEKNG